MNTTRSCVIISAILLVFLSINGYGQGLKKKDSVNEKLVSVAKKIMNATKTCALITLDSDGHPRARMMDPFPPEDDLTVWFGTNPKSRKVSQIKANSSVTLYYAEKDSNGYVMIQGVAKLVNDSIEKERYWKNSWTSFYPDKTDSYLLIKVKPTRLEVVSYTYGITGDSISWKPPVVKFTSNN